MDWTVDWSCSFTYRPYTWRRTQRHLLYVIHVIYIDHQFFNLCSHSHYLRSTFSGWLDFKFRGYAQKNFEYRECNTAVSTGGCSTYVFIFLFLYWLVKIFIFPNADIAVNRCGVQVTNGVVSLGMGAYVRLPRLSTTLSLASVMVPGRPGQGSQTPRTSLTVKRIHIWLSLFKRNISLSKPLLFDMLHPFLI